MQIFNAGRASAITAEPPEAAPTITLVTVIALHALRGERDQAFSWLNRAYQENSQDLLGSPPITIEPDLRNLHADPRWAAFLRKMSLP
jgi:hypothetical protein